MKFDSVDAILDFAITKEEDAAQFYTDLAGKMKQQHMKDVFEQFALEEKSHKAKLEKVKEGKYNEYMKHESKVQMEYFDIEGMKFKSYTYLTGIDALSLVGMLMPPE